MVSFKGAHFQQDMILTRVRWYVAYPLSHRHLEEMIQERGVSGDQATINRWVLNSIGEQDHRGVKRIAHPVLWFKSFAAAQGTLVGIELMHMGKKGQMVVEEGVKRLTLAEQFYALAA
jgi:transposase-like protein